MLEVTVAGETQCTTPLSFFITHGVPKVKNILSTVILDGGMKLGDLARRDLDWF